MFTSNNACIYMYNDVRGDVAHCTAISIARAGISRVRRIHKGHLGIWGSGGPVWPGLSGHVCRRPLASFPRDDGPGTKPEFSWANDRRDNDSTPPRQTIRTGVCASARQKLYKKRSG